MMGKMIYAQSFADLQIRELSMFAWSVAGKSK